MTYKVCPSDTSWAKMMTEHITDGGKWGHRSHVLTYQFNRKEKQMVRIEGDLNDPAIQQLIRIDEIVFKTVGWSIIR